MTSHSVSDQSFNILNTQMMNPYEQYLSMMYRNQFNQNMIPYLPAYRQPMAPLSHLQTLPSAFGPSFNLLSSKEAVDKIVPSALQTKPTQERKKKKKNATKQTAPVDRSHHSKDLEAIHKKVKHDTDQSINLCDSTAADYVQQGCTPSSAASTVISDSFVNQRPTSKLDKELIAPQKTELMPTKRIIEISYNKDGNIVYHIGYDGDSKNKQLGCYTREEVIKQDPRLLMYFYENHIQFKNQPNFSSKKLIKL